jgi:hypothetical protein
MQVSDNVDVTDTIIAKTYGKIIISEAFIPNEAKTIKPVEDLGGQAGGPKYIYMGIFMKFALDWKEIYGNDEYSMKAARFVFYLQH